MQHINQGNEGVGRCFRKKREVNVSNAADAHKIILEKILDLSNWKTLTKGVVAW
jgi:hypothetical protein